MISPQHMQQISCDSEYHRSDLRPAGLGFTRPQRVFDSRSMASPNGAQSFGGGVEGHARSSVRRFESGRLLRQLWREWFKALGPQSNARREVQPLTK